MPDEELYSLLKPSTLSKSIIRPLNNSRDLAEMDKHGLNVLVVYNQNYFPLMKYSS